MGDVRVGQLALGGGHGLPHSPFVVEIRLKQCEVRRRAFRSGELVGMPVIPDAGNVACQRQMDGSEMMPKCVMVQRVSVEDNKGLHAGQGSAANDAGTGWRAEGDSPGVPG